MPLKKLNNMSELNDELLEVEEEPKLGFIRLIGEESDGYYRYEFIFTNNINEFWGENFEYKPC